MTKALTKRQAIILFSILIISLKLQRLPALLAEDFGRDLWVAMLFLCVCDLLALFLILWSIKKLNGKTLFEFIEQNAGKWLVILIGFMVILFFFFKAMIAYKQLHEFFANTLFSKLPWKSFSVLFLALMLLMVGSGLNNIGRTGEFFIYVMGFSLLIIFILGAFTGTYSHLLPILDIKLGVESLSIFKYAPWFTDSLILLFLAGNIKVDGKIDKPLVLTYVISSVIMVIGTVIFYSINENLSVFQDNALTSMTEESLIGLGIGRPDWFLVLFANIGGIITTSATLWVASDALKNMFNIKNGYVSALVVVILVYLWDLLIYQNLELSIFITKEYASYYMIAFSILLPILVIIMESCKKKINKRLRGRKDGKLFKEKC